MAARCESRLPKGNGGRSCGSIVSSTSSVLMAPRWSMTCWCWARPCNRWGNGAATPRSAGKTILRGASRNVWTDLRSSTALRRRPACPSKASSAEAQRLHHVIGGLAERDGVVDRQGAEGRGPGQADTDRGAHDVLVCHLQRLARTKR